MIDIPHRRREKAHKAFRIGLALLVILSVPIGLAAAQTAEEPKQCPDGPPIRGETGTQPQGLEILFLNDDSTSMDTVTSSGDTRLELLKQSVGIFIEGVEQDTELAHVTTADGDSGSVVTANHLESSLTTDHALVNSTVQNLSTELDQDDGAAFTIANDTLQTGTNATDSSQKVIIYVTDGEPFNAATALQEAENFRSNGGVIFTIGIGNSVNDTYLIDIAGDESRYYESPNATELDSIYQEVQIDVGNIRSGLSVETRDLYLPGETHGYTVTEIVEENGTVVETNDVTDSANITINSAYNGTLFTVNQNGTLTAVNDENASDWARIDASYNSSTGCTNAIVSQPTVKNIELVPGIWRLNALMGDSTIFFILLATLAAVAMTRFTSAFGGIAVAQVVMAVGWLAGYVAWAFAAASLFIGLFIGLNLAANIDYSVGRFR